MLAYSPVVNINVPKSYRAEKLKITNAKLVILSIKIFKIMKSRNLILIVIVGLILLLGGCGVFR